MAEDRSFQDYAHSGEITNIILDSTPENIDVEADIKQNTADISTLNSQALTADQKAAIDGASTPAAGNVFATISDLGTGGGDMLKSIYDANDNGIVDNSALVNGLTVETAVPVGAVFTDNDTITTVEDVLTSTSSVNALSANQGKILDDKIAAKVQWSATESAAITASTGNTIDLFIADEGS